MEILGSARRHGIEDADIQHAWLNAIRLAEYDYQGEDRLLVIGADHHGRLLELVAVPAVHRPGSSTPTCSARSSTTT